MIGFGGILLAGFGSYGQSSNSSAITRADLESAQKLPGLHFSSEKLDMMLPSLEDRRKDYEVLRHAGISNAVPSAMLFNPIPVGFVFETNKTPFKGSPLPEVKLPKNLDDIAFFSLSELASLIKSRQLTSVQLTQLYLERLKKYGPKDRKSTRLNSSH